MSKLSKIALFVYNRPVHTSRVLNSLNNNYLSEKSEVYIFSDYPKSKKDIKNVSEVRKIIKNFKGFKKKRIILRKKNFGLAKNFISGITHLLNKFEKLIILEDDNLMSPYFLTFMNDALELYKNSSKVGSISGYSYDLNTSENTTFFSSFIPSWGWGTWKRAWKLNNLNGKFLVKKINKLKKVKQFNLDNSYDFMRILKNQASGINNSWSIRWYASLFLKKKLALFNTQSYVKNIGFDGSGVHTPKTSIFNVKILNDYKRIKKINISIDKKYNKKLMNFFKKLSKREKIINYYNRIKHKLRKII